MTTKPVNSAVAAEIRAERAAQRLTTRELASRADLDHRTMLRYMNDERPINIDRLARFACGLGLTPQDLLARALVRMADAEQMEILRSYTRKDQVDKILAERAESQVDDDDGDMQANVR